MNMAHLQMILPAINLHLEGTFHSYVKNQMANMNLTSENMI